MSAVLWHTRDHDQTVLSGSERAHARALADEIAWSLIRPRIYDRESLLPYLVDAPDYITRSIVPEETLQWVSSVRSWLGDWSAGGLLLDGKVEPFGDLALNTLVAMNRPLRLMAWMHGMCENHGYFEPESHDVLEETIREGRAAGIMRDGVGWENVLALIKEIGGDGPIVWSYTVCESFPDRTELYPPRNPGQSQEDYEDACDLVYDIPDAEVWDLCMEKLKATEWPVALHPDNAEIVFLNGKTAFDFQAQLWRDKPWEKVDASR